MATEAAPLVRLDRDELTRLHMMVEKMVFFQMADVINRLSPQGKPPYTKMEVPDVRVPPTL